MQLFLSTPVLRALVRELNKFDNRLALAIIRTDNYIKGSSYLRELFGSDSGDEMRQLSPFLNEDLIKKTIKDCVAKEAQRRNLPRLVDSTLLVQLSDEEALRRCEREVTIGQKGSTLVLLTSKM